MNRYILPESRTPSSCALLSRARNDFFLSFVDSLPILRRQPSNPSSAAFQSSQDSAHFESSSIRRNTTFCAARCIVPSHSQVRSTPTPPSSAPLLLVVQRTLHVSASFTTRSSKLEARSSKPPRHRCCQTTRRQLLHPASCISQAASRKLHPAHCTLPIAHCELQIAHCKRPWTHSIHTRYVEGRGG